MSYIEREAVLLHLNDIWLSAMPTDTMYDDDRQLAMVRCMGLNDAMDVVKEEPAADARPVVLCRDCKWYQIDELKKDGTADRRYKPSVCVLAEQRRDPNHFCADGVKREES